MHDQLKKIYLIIDYCFDSVLNPFNEFSGKIKVMTSGIIQVSLFIYLTNMPYLTIEEPFTLRVKPN